MSGRVTRSGKRYSLCNDDAIHAPKNFSLMDCIRRAEGQPPENELAYLEHETDDDDSFDSASTLVAESRSPTIAPDTPDRVLPNSTTPKSSNSVPLTRTQRNNLRFRRKRNVKLQAAKQSCISRLKEKCATKYRTYAEQNPIRIEVDTSADFQVSRPGWIGLREKEQMEDIYTLDEMKENFPYMHIVEWDGRKPRPIVDCSNLAFAMLGGRPDGSNWDEVVEGSNEVMKNAAGKLKFTDKQKSHRRGEFPAVAVGVSYGGGQEEPMTFVHTKKNATILKSIVDDSHINRVSGFANCLFETFAPMLFLFYRAQQATLQQRIPSLKFPFRNSVFSAVTLNFGPQTISKPHLDSNNLAWGWCVITALGNYNPDLGGHLVLWDLDLIIRFPPGSTILIPSALLRHSNVAIPKGQTRYSITQYSAGGLFRWIANGFCSNEEVEARADATEKAQREAARARRYRDGLRMYSKVVSS